LRTYIYKLTSDRGGAPCAPPPTLGSRLLTLSICKPAIRRTAQPGDRIVGITSHALAECEGYPLNAVIYAAIVSSALDSREYFAPRGEFRSRPDCIYTFRRSTGLLEHARKTRLHVDSAHAATDVGRHPYYRNARTLLSHDFRYLGVTAKRIPSRLINLTEIAQHPGQGHRVFEEGSPVGIELDALFRLLWGLPTAFTPVRVEEEAYGRRLRKPLAAKTSCREC
jgi:Nucleotide modification associated domain 2